MTTVISVENLSKTYRLGQIGTGTFTNDLKLWWAKARGKPNPLLRIGETDHGNRDGEDLWALRDVSFTVEQGEVLGIIGRNGAGKSTLLKILSRVTAPTSGKIKIKGRIASLLEVGTGFHPELTGRENIYLNGAILGMSKDEVKRKFDEIVDFSGVEKFIDTPVKRYSSGMYVRLAFAVAAHLDPEILVVDEVLAVGDAEFQRKCLGKMGAVAKEGRTVLFVSHNMTAMSTLTQRCLLLNSGQITIVGPTNSVVQKYRYSGLEDSADEYIDQNKEQGVIYARVITSEGSLIHQHGKPLSFEFEIKWKSKPKSGFFSFQVVNEEWRPIIHLWISSLDLPLLNSKKIKLQCILPNPRIYLGRYTLITYLSDRGANQHLETLQGICTFDVVMDGINREYDWRPGTCTYLEDAEWKTKKM